MKDFKYTTDTELKNRIDALEAEVKAITDGNGQMLISKGLKKGDKVKPVDVRINQVDGKDNVKNGVFLIVFDNGATCGAKWFDVEQTAKALMEWVNENHNQLFKVTKARKSQGTITNGVKSDDYEPSFYEFKKCDAEGEIITEEH